MKRTVFLDKLHDVNGTSFLYCPDTRNMQHIQVCLVKCRHHAKCSRFKLYMEVEKNA